MAKGLRQGAALNGGRYRIEGVLGQGSFGITYLATAKFTSHGSLGPMDVFAKVAIKEFFMSDVNTRSEDGTDVIGSAGSVFSNYRKKFKREAETLSRLQNPNIVRVFDIFDENSTTYYVMEFIEGENLDNYIARKGKIEESEAIAIIREVGEALNYMHSEKMLHLDIKPKNIMRTPEGKHYLIDFGLSKQFSEEGEPESSTTIGLGTPGYAPLEQATYRQKDGFPATLDVYALGATLFKMLTGTRPPEATVVLNDGFPADRLYEAGVSTETVRAVEKSMAPLKKDRYKDVERFLNHLPATEKRVQTLPAVMPSTLPQTSGEPISENESARALSPVKAPGPEPAKEPESAKKPAPHPIEIPDTKPLIRRFSLRNRLTWLWLGVSLLLVAGIVILFTLTGSSKDDERESRSRSGKTAYGNVTEEDAVIMGQKNTGTAGNSTETGTSYVSEMEMRSPLAPDYPAMIYSGEVKWQKIDGKDFPVPHGNGVAIVQSGDYAGQYAGYFQNGNMEGDMVYAPAYSNLVFEGIFKDNEPSHGKMTDKESGSYFYGYFKDWGPDNGLIYDSNNEITATLVNGQLMESE